jgi:hypothetical protein
MKCETWRCETTVTSGKTGTDAGLQTLAHTETESTVERIAKEWCLKEHDRPDVHEAD